MIAKPISIKDAKRKFGGCAQKAVELIAGDLRPLDCGQQNRWPLGRNDSWSSGVGDFSEDGGAASAGGGRKIGGAAVKGFVGHKGESQGFFGFGGNGEMGGWQDLDGSSKVAL